MAATVYPGPFILFSATEKSTGPGTSYFVPPNLRLGGLQSLQVGSSGGVTITSTCSIQGSNDGNTWTDIVGTTLAINGVTPQSAALAMSASHGGWAYVRAAMQSGTSSTVGSTGESYSMKVLANFVERTL